MNIVKLDTIQSSIRQIKKYYQIAVKQEADGAISNWLHHSIHEGDEVDIAPPTGGFHFNDDTAQSVTLISSGIGQTPLLAMLNRLVEIAYPGNVHWLHVARNGISHAFADEVSALGNKLPKFTLSIWYSQPRTEDVGRYQLTGRMDLTPLRHNMTTPSNQFWLCGPSKFMLDIDKQLTDFGIEKQAIQYENFGPHKAISA